MYRILQEEKPRWSWHTCRLSMSVFWRVWKTVSISLCFLLRGRAEETAGHLKVAGHFQSYLELHSLRGGHSHGTWWRKGASYVCLLETYLQCALNTHQVSSGWVTATCPKRTPLTPCDFTTPYTLIPKPYTQRIPRTYTLHILKPYSLHIPRTHLKGTHTPELKGLSCFPCPPARRTCQTLRLLAGSIYFVCRFRFQGFRLQVWGLGLKLNVLCILPPKP